MSSETPLKTNYAIPGIVSDVHEEFGSKYIGGAGKDCAFERYSLGWYVTFSGSHEALFFGYDKPDFNPGDKVKITFARITDNGKTTDDQITSRNNPAN